MCRVAPRRFKICNPTLQVSRHEKAWVFAYTYELIVIEFDVSNTEGTIVCEHSLDWNPPRLGSKDVSILREDLKKHKPMEVRPTARLTAPHRTAPCTDDCCIWLYADETYIGGHYSRYFVQQDFQRR